MKKSFLFLLFSMCSLVGVSQTTITGVVLDANSEIPIPGVNISISGASSKYITNFDGKFKINTDKTPPFELQISGAGFQYMTVEITNTMQMVEILLKEVTKLDEIVVLASRTPERIFESPSAIEHIGIKEINNTPSSDFYGGLENLKGVDINTNSFTFRSINTRGFATFMNSRFLQLVDGMDNSAPVLNFPLGNLLGLIDVDLKSVQLLPGTSSALYGANAFNGVLLMTSKNPFEFPGISGYSKTGITSQRVSGDNLYTDIGVRIAHKFNNKWAAKVNFGYLQGTDWGADNIDGKQNKGNSRADSDYDGVNVYGDEVSRDLGIISGFGIIPKGTIVSRTGYNESDLTDYKAENFKTDWGLYFRPNGGDMEISYVGKYGSGSTIIQGTNRYVVDNFSLIQHKLEVRNESFFMRAFVTEDNAGDSYDMVFTGININNEAKTHENWFRDYITSYTGGLLSASGRTEQQLHDAARAYADGETSNGSARFSPGTPEFKAAFDKVTKDPDLTKGSKFQDNSKYYQADANYNFKEQIKFFEVQVGGTFKRFSLNSSGTIFTDKDDHINYSEFGIYTQIQKKFLEDGRLKLTGSLRYDKSELFKGFLSPRISLGYTFGNEIKQNVRISFQTGFRNPTTQNLFTGLNVGSAILIGGSFNNPRRYVKTHNLSPDGAAIVGNTKVTQQGEAAYTNSFSASSLETFSVSRNPADLKIANPSYVEPERITSFEIGYRVKFRKINLDMSVYYSAYKNFLSNEDVVSPFYGVVGNGLSLEAIANGDYQVYRTYTNIDANINSYGAVVGISSKIFGNYDLGINYTYAKLDFDQSAYPDFSTNFNTPEHKLKAIFGNTEVFKNVGFNLAWRWSGSYIWEATFGDGAIPNFHVVDAQVNFKVPTILNSMFKVGATNLLGDEYFTAFGTGHVGSKYYISWVVNVF